MQKNEAQPARCSVLVFGGTVEGRLLCEWLSARGACDVVVSCATAYGGELVTGLPGVEVHVGTLDAAQKDQLVADHGFSCIVDATHPFATHVTESVAALARAHGIPLLRLTRDDDVPEGCQLVETVDAAARYVAARAGRILLTTGTKDLATFVAAVPDFAERLYVRLLPVPDSVAHARELDIPASHIIAMQGPFSVELNRVLLQDLAISMMVAKASGASGGLAEKAQAAQDLGVELVLIGRPTVERGLSLAQVKAELEARYGA